MALFNLPNDRYWRDPSITTWKFLSLCLNPSYYTPKVKRERKLCTNTLRTEPPYSRPLITGFILSYSSNGLQGCYPLHRMFLVVTIHHIGDYGYYLARLGAGRRICTIIFCMGYRRITYATSAFFLREL